MDEYYEGYDGWDSVRELSNANKITTIKEHNQED